MERTMLPRLDTDFLLSVAHSLLENSYAFLVVSFPSQISKMECKHTEKSSKNMIFQCLLLLLRFQAHVFMQATWYQPYPQNLYNFFRIFMLPVTQLLLNVTFLNRDNLPMWQKIGDQGRGLIFLNQIFRLPLQAYAVVESVFFIIGHSYQAGRKPKDSE